MPIFFPAKPSPLEPSGTVTAAAKADPVDFEAMATEQNCCPKTKRLLGGSSLKLAFQQAGAQHSILSAAVVDRLHQQPCSHRPTAHVGHSRGFFRHFDDMIMDEAKTKWTSTFKED
jgi:hypothetical protein